MAGLRLDELSADSALIVNRLELRPGQEDFATPTTYTEEEPGIDPTKTWARVIKKDDEVVGFVRAYFDEDYHAPELRCSLWNLTVTAPHQGAGVGRFGVEAVVDEARARGCEKLTVMWAPGAEGPGEFFHRLGFVDSGESSYGDQIGSLAIS